MRGEPLIDRIHAAATRNPLLLRFTQGTRVLLSVGFLAPGMTKLLGHRFVTVVTDDPVGRFFEALYQAGAYWRFLGAAQVLAAVLVMSRRTTALGALLFVGITLNISLITVSLSFGNTAIVAALMLLASVWLLLWDYPRWASLLGLPPPAFEEDRLARGERLGWLICASGGWGVTCVTRGLFGSANLPVFWASLALGLTGGLLVLVAWVRAWRRRPIR